MKRQFLTSILFVMILAAGLGCGGDGESVEEAGVPADAAAIETATESAAADRPVASTTDIPQAQLNPALPGTVERDLTYCSAGGEALGMDIYYPQTMDGPAPLVLYVHGGGWTQGSKEADGGLMRTFESLNAAGFIVASIDYRLAPKFRFPAQIEDVKCAVRYLRANAGRHGLDPERIGALGGSAGGHLVSLLGVTDGDEGLEGDGGYAEESSRVQAVVDMFGPTDLTVEFEGGAIGRELGANLFGTSDRTADILRVASPVTYVTADDPPFLILHGDRDALVPPEQSRDFYDLLLAAGVDARLVMVANAGHGFRPEGGTPDPTRAEIAGVIVEFFRETLDQE